MATSNAKSSGNSLTQDSDEVDEMYCEHCEKLLGKYVPAEGFCVNCVEYMCDTCLRYHKLYMATHTLQDKNTMPQDFYLEKCDVHTNQLIKFFCSDCQKRACSECKVNDHKDCSSVRHLPALAEGVEKSKELSDLFKSVENLSAKIDKMTDHISSNIQRISSETTEALLTINKCKEEVIAAYKKHQQGVIDNFDKKMKKTIARLKKKRENLIEQEAEKLKMFEEKFNHAENETVRKVKTSKDTDQTKLQSLKDTNLKIKMDLNEVSTDLVRQKNFGQRCKIFITMKKAQRNTEKLRLIANKVNKNMDMHSTRHVDVPKTNVLDAKSLENTDIFFHFREFPSSRRKRTAEHHSDLSVKADIWSSLCLLSDNTLLMTDFDGSSILIYQNMSVNNKKYHTIRLPNHPWAVTRVKDNQVAVTFPDEGIVRLITFSESMTVINTDDITVGRECRGIACSNNNLIVTYSTNPGKVQILDVSGNVLKCFDKDCNGRPLFSEPWYLTLSADNTTIYVSDWGNNTVTSMTLDGKVKAIYRDDQLRHPRQLTVDEAGTVYVCGSWSDNVYQLSSDLIKVKILLDESQGMNRPVSAAYCQNNHRLYVGMLGSSSIKVFNVLVE